MFMRMPTRRCRYNEYIIAYRDARIAGKVALIDTTPKAAATHVAHSLGYMCRQTFQNVTYDYVYDLQKPHPHRVSGLQLQVLNCQTGKVKIYCVTN